MALLNPFNARLLIAILLLLPGSSLFPQQASPGDGSITTFRTNVRRVIVDVVVTDKDGKTVPGLTREDFSLYEDNTPQQVLSFEPLGFTSEMDYLPPKLPAEPPNTFVNLPTLPEKGPLYVLLYDLVNMESNEEQILARQQLLNFIGSKPEGTRFAIFMLSDGLHLAQGFTSDKSLLYAAMDPHHSRPHVPKIFLMGKNFGQGDAPTTTWVLRALASYLDGLPGRKNIIWLSGGFPLALFPSEKDNLLYYKEVRQMFDLLARNQIAIYPVDSRGVAVDNPHAPPGAVGPTEGLSSDSREHAAASSNTPTPGTSAAAGSGAAGAGATGYSLLSSSYMAEDEIARVTGGRAFYSTNDIAAALEHATEEGSSYYSLSYAPSDSHYDDKLHTIRVQLAKKGYTLAYRRSYYALDPNKPRLEAVANPASSGQAQIPERAPGDSLNAYMEHGAPAAHALIFGAHIAPVGLPAIGTPEQMAELAEQTRFFHTRRKGGTIKPLAPVKLQRYALSYTVMAHQLQLAGREPDLELAAAAYDADGTMLNAVVSRASADKRTGLDAPKSYRAEQILYVPMAAASIRVAVRDGNTDRIGAMEVALPLQPEPSTTSAARAAEPGR